jgi:hypothetical protein
MNENEKQELTNQQWVIEDLAVNQTQAAALNGGSYRTISGKITSVSVDPSDPIR